MNHKFRSTIRRAVSSLLIVTLLSESMPIAFALDAVSSIQSSASSSAETSVTAKKVTPQSSARSIAELSSAYNIKKDSAGKVQSVAFTADNQPTREELRVLFGDRLTASISSETAELAIADEISSSLCKKYSLSQADIQRGIALHEDAYALKHELSGLDLTKEKFTVSQTTSDQIVKLIANGFSNSEASAAVISCSILGLTADDVIAAKAAELQSDQSVAGKDASKRKSVNAALAQRLGIPVSVLDEYVKTHKIDADAIDKQYTEKLTEFFAPKAAAAAAAVLGADDSFAPDEIIGQPYTYESNGEVDVALNSGDFSYTETDLSIPGVNGLDLNIQRQYNSVMAMTGTPYGRFDLEIMFREVFCVNYRVYEYHNLNDTDGAFDRPNERYDWEDYGNLNPGFSLEDRWFATDEYNEALLALQSSPYAAVITVNPRGEQVIAYVVPALDAVSPMFEAACTNRIRDYSYTVDEYGLGNGWRFNFPSIEKYRARNFTGDYDVIGDDTNYKRRLVLPNGTRYEIDFDADEYSNLVGYTLEDMKMYNSGRGYAGAAYTLEYRDGTSYYFNKSGKILAITDAYENEISFDYPTNDETEFVSNRQISR